MAGCGMYYTRRVELTSLERQGRAAGVAWRGGRTDVPGEGAGHAESEAESES